MFQNQLQKYVKKILTKLKYVKELSILDILAMVELKFFFALLR